MSYTSLSTVNRSRTLLDSFVDTLICPLGHPHCVPHAEKWWGGTRPRSPWRQRSYGWFIWIHGFESPENGGFTWKSPLWKGTSSEPNLHDLGFQNVSFRGVVSKCSLLFLSLLVSIISSSTILCCFKDVETTKIFEWQQKPTGVHRFNIISTGCRIVNLVNPNQSNSRTYHHHHHHHHHLLLLLHHHLCVHHHRHLKKTNKWSQIYIWKWLNSDFNDQRKGYKHHDMYVFQIWNPSESESINKLTLTRHANVCKSEVQVVFTETKLCLGNW